MKINAGAASRLRTLRKERKLIYVTPNIPTPPMRALAGLSRSTQERGFASLFHLSTLGSPSVRDAAIPATVCQFPVARLGGLEQSSKGMRV